MLKRARTITLIICILLSVFLIVGCKSTEGPVYKTLSDLEGARFGIVTGSTFDKTTQETWDNYEALYTNSTSDNLTALLSNKVDAFLADKPWALYLCNSNEDVTFLDEMLGYEEYGFVFSKSDEGTALRDDFNAYLAELPDREQMFADLEAVWFDPKAEHPVFDYQSLPEINGSIHICLDSTSEPFNYYENDNLVGYNIELLYGFCKSRGYAMIVDDMKAAGLIPAVTTGKYDIACNCITITEERKESVNFSDPVYDGGPVVVIRTENAVTAANNAEGNPIYKTLADLDGARFSVMTGSTFDALTQETWKNAEILYTDSNNDSLTALLSNKVDAYVTDRPVALYACNSNKDVTFMDEMLGYEEYGFVFAKSNEGAVLRDDFNAYLAEFTDQEFADLEAVWFDANAEHPELDYESLPATNGTMHVCLDATGVPFNYYEGDKITGYNIELLYGFCKSRGYGMTTDDVKFASMIPGIITGKYDIAADCITITEERKESVNFSDPVYTGGPVVVIRTENSVNAGTTTESSSFLAQIAESFEKTFIREDRWKLFLDGIGLTLFITVISLIAGTLLGFLLYMWFRRGGKVCKVATDFLSWLITGMPEVLLLMIMFYIVFGSSTITGTWVSIMAFTLIVGVNFFGMMKSGVAAVDRGQMEAALAIGYSETYGFFRLIFPQALQHIMPSYRGSIVSLIKSTAIVGYLAVQDLTKVSDIIRSRTYEAFFPLVATAALYFVLAWLLVAAVNILQKVLLPIRSSRKAILKGIDTKKGAEK